MKIRNWGFAAGLAAALAFAGSAHAQSAGTSPQAGDTGQGGSASQASPGAQSDTRAGSTGAASGSTAATASTGAKVDKDLKEKIQKIHAGNKAEIHMAQMGAQKAESPEVKAFAEKLQRDHQNLDERLTQVAQSAGIELQGKDYDKKHDRAMKDMDKLQKKSGAEFDREFMSHMVKDHEKDLKDVKSAARDAEKANHSELAAVLNQAEQGMQGHKDEAERIKDSLGKGGARAEGRSGTAGSTGSGAQTTPSGGAAGTSSDRVGERGGDTGQSRGDTAAPSGTGTMGSGTATGSTGAGAQTTPSGGAAGTSSDRVGERGGDTGQARGDTQPGTAAGSTGAEAGSTGAQTPSAGAEGTSSDRAGERSGDTGQPREGQQPSGERRY